VDRLVEAEFLKEFQWITMTKGHSHSYIGKQLSTGWCRNYGYEIFFRVHFARPCLRAMLTPGGKNGLMLDERIRKGASIWW
jgi:hypothetical protein